MPKRLTAEEKARRAARPRRYPGRPPKEKRIRIQAVVLELGQRQTLITVVTTWSSSNVMKVLQRMRDEKPEELPASFEW